MANLVASAQALGAEPDESRLLGLIERAAEALPRFDDPSFGALFDRYAQARVVLLGESTHGTSEFYRARAEITKRLVQKHGFSIVAVEADWPDASHVHAYISGAERPSALFCASRPGCGGTRKSGAGRLAS